MHRPRRGPVAHAAEVPLAVVAGHHEAVRSARRLAGHRVSVGRFQIGLEPEVATLARLQRTVERVGPAFAIAPASLAANPATVDLKRCRRIRSPERHHVGIEDGGCADRPIDLTLRRKLPDEGRLGDTTGPGHQQPGHHPSAQHRR